MVNIFTNESNYKDNSRQDAKTAKVFLASLASWREKSCLFHALANLRLGVAGFKAKKSATESAAPNNNHQRRMEEYVLNKGGEIQNMSTF